MTESDNLKQVLAALELRKQAYDVAISQATFEIASKVATKAKTSVNRKRKKGSYPATSGEPPMKVTGNLLRGITADSKRKGFGVYVAEVGSYMEYARVLELGGAPTWTRGQKFPYLQPALDQFKASNQIRTIIAKHLRKASRV